MTMIDPASFDPSMTAAEVWDTINSLPVSFQKFAEQSFLYSRLYGVNTGAVEGTGGDIIINSCLRQSVWTRLAFVGNETEVRLGYNFTPRYHYEEFRMWSNNQGRYATQWPGIAAMSVKPKWTVVEDYGPFTISPYLPIEVTVLTPETQPVVQFSAAAVENPLDIQFRNASTKKLYVTLGAPRRSGGNWQVSLDTKLSGFDPAVGVVLQHKKMAMVDVDAPPVGVLGTLLPVYPGTHQIIPQLKSPAAQPDGKIRYYFPIYALVDPAFDDTTTNLETGEVWKLLQTFEILAFTQEAAPAELVWSEQVKQIDGTYLPVTRKVNVTLVPDGNEMGVYVVKYKDAPVIYPHLVWEDAFGTCTTCCSTMPGLPLLRVWYYTNPRNLPEIQRSQIPALLAAIGHRVAAELPVEACGCKVNTGFIAENQNRFDSFKLNPHSGLEVRSTKFTDTYGRMRYEDILRNMQQFQPLVVI
jgi:hypothetical protein